MTKPIPKSHFSLKCALAIIFFALPLVVVFYGHARANSAPNIKLNGTDQISTLSSSGTLTVTIQLNAGDQTGKLADWWILAETPMGWYCYVYPGMWTLQGSNGADLLPAYQGTLFNMAAPLEVLQITGLPAGPYVFYFGVDTTVDGLLNMSTLTYDWAAVQVVETGSYPLVDTGQETCYGNSGIISCPGAGESFYGQDAQHIGSPPQYTDNDNGTITDNITGLMWQRSPDTDGNGAIDADDKLTYEQATTGANTLSLGGYHDWRLPTIKELYSLILFSGLDPSGLEGTDISGLKPFIDTTYFDFAYGDTSAGERIIDAQYASSTRYVSTTMNGSETMFGVNFADGRIKGYGIEPMPGQTEGKKFFVIYVRGNTGYGQNHLLDNGDGTISDNATGLMWAQNDSGTGLNWEEALAWVEQKNTENYLGHNDWRLPDSKELQSIVDYKRSPDTTGSAAIDPLFNTTSITNEAGQADYPFYWSGTTHANGSEVPGGFGAYVAFGRAMGYMNGSWIDVHGAGAQRSDPKSGDPADWPTGHGPQGDAIRIYNYVRLVRDVSLATSAIAY